MNKQKVKKYILHHTDDWAVVVRDILPDVPPHTIILLAGPLGAGKTTFAKLLLSELGIPASQVTSPTYTLIEEFTHQGEHYIHADLYRANPNDERLPHELIELTEAADLSLIEWPERLNALQLFPRAWHLQIDLTPTERQITLSRPATMSHHETPH